jgi:outer membrane protein assembly factor BamB
VRRAPFAILILALLAACGTTTVSNGSSSTAGRTDPSSTAPPTTVPAATPGPNLAPGSNPAVLPAPVLIADHFNDRLVIVDQRGNVVWEFPQPGDLAPGQSFQVPDDAFFTPDGRQIVVTQEDDFVISLVDVATHRIVWQYGVPGQPGSGPNHLWNPDDAMMMPNGDIIAADIKNCRIVILKPGVQTPLHVIGETTQACRHQPPTRWGSPNGAFPMSNGSYLVTEINGDWVNQLALNGTVAFSTHPPGVSYPSDSNEISPNTYLTVDYSNPGQIETFNSSGQLIWRFKPTGANALNQPSLAVPLPNGDILANDDYNNRVIVVDPRTNQIVWQYGHTGVPGVAPGYLRVPDGVDLMPPYSFTIVHASTMGTTSP